MASAAPREPPPRESAARERDAYGYQTMPNQPRRYSSEMMPPADIPAEGGDYRRAGNPSLFERIFGGG